MKRRENRKKKGTALVEVVLAIAILSLPLVILLTVLSSEKPLISYTADQLILSSLASSKMSEIEQSIRANPQYYKVGGYYGFKWAPGSDNDIACDPANADTSQVDGTFYKVGYPEYRYQFYITEGNNGLRKVHLLCWRRPKVSGALILKTTLYCEIYGGTSGY